VISPRRGEIYLIDPGLGTAASHALVVSENAWNDMLSDSVIVPLFQSEGAKTALTPRIGDLRADCSLVRVFEQESLYAFDREASATELTEVELGIRTFLDLDNLIQPPKLDLPVTAGRPDWWPKLARVYYGKRFADQRERYGVISPDEWNVRNDYASCIFITSRYKQWRSRWQVTVGKKSYAITCDIEPFTYTALSHDQPRDWSRISRDQMSDVATGVANALQL
jgi:mRNA-degrading endonuclease toxin of MazEF toxin-antitoxin module